MAKAIHKEDERVDLADTLCGRVLNGRFSILEPIGSGGMGKVYKAIQAPLDRVVAVKVLHPQFSGNRDPGFMRRFVLEASLTSKLRHPNTVTVIDYGQTEDGIFFIAMEYLEGQSLADLLLERGALPWQRALYIGQQVCRSLREAHRFGIIHRDLKPANVMLLDESDHDLVKVLDFGLVKSFVGDEATEDVRPDSKITQAGMLLGSPQYMSPEQARNRSDPRSDVYSFGVVLYEMLMGRPPFTAKDYLEVIVKHLKEPPPPFQVTRPDASIPAEVEHLVFRCLEKNPADRFQSMDEVLEGIRALGVGGIQSSFGDSRALGTHPGFAAGSASGGTPPPIPGRQVTPLPDMSPYTPAPLPPGTPPPYMRPSSGAPGSSPGLGRRSGPVVAPTPAPRIFSGVAPVEAEAASPSGSATVAERAVGNVFSASQEQSGSRWRWVGIGLVAVLLVGVIGYLLSRSGPEPAAPAKAPVAEATGTAPAPGATATATTTPPTTTPPTDPPPAAPASGKLVKFRVMTDPPGAQVFLGARAMGASPVEFEVPSDQPDGTVTVDMVLFQDGYFPLTVTAGGSGVVLITQRLQKRSGTGPGFSASGSRRGGKRAPAVPHDGSGKVDAPELVAVAPPIALQAPPDLPNPYPETTDKAPEPPRPAATPTPAAGGPVVAPPPSLSVPGAVQFDGETMSRPQIIDRGKPLQYTPEALRARVSGLMIVKCVIAVTGKLENCRFIKSLPYMEKAVLDALASRTYKPLTQDGKPVPVDYVFEVKLKLPAEM